MIDIHVSHVTNNVDPNANSCLFCCHVDRYLIVIDDVWDIITWEIIRCALVDSNHGSKIITTTRIFEVATKASDIHNLEPLSPDSSIELLYRRLFWWKWKIP